MAGWGKSGLILSRLRTAQSYIAKADLLGIPSVPIVPCHALPRPFKLCPCGVFAKGRTLGDSPTSD